MWLFTYNAFSAFDNTFYFIFLYFTMGSRTKPFTRQDNYSETKTFDYSTMTSIFNPDFNSDNSLFGVRSTRQLSH